MAISIFDWQSAMPFALRFNPHIKANFHALLRNKAFLIIPVYFFIVLSGVFYSDDYGYLLERLRIRLPFLVLPFAFISFPPFPKRYYEGILYFFLLFMFLASIVITFNYWQDYETITQLMGKGKPIPTPVNHIRFSLALAFSILSGATLYYHGFFLRYRWERFFILFITIFLFFVLHLSL